MGRYYEQRYEGMDTVSLKNITSVYVLHKRFGSCIIHERLFCFVAGIARRLRCRCGE